MLLRHHVYFACVLTAATALRVLAMTAYPPALWFNDSFDYVRIGLAPFPHPVRPDGYGYLLWLLRPFHSFALVTAVQHLMGLATGTMIYALLRQRFALGGRVATLATVPVLFDAYQVELEHLVMSDVLFIFLVTCALTVLLWRPVPTWRTGCVAALLLASAALTRTVGLPLVLLALVFLIACRTSWRTVAVTALTAALPLVAYALWFQSANDRFTITGVDGVFLWGRTAAFADCAKIKPPPDLAPLCPRTPAGLRPASSTLVWQPDSPMGWRVGHPFDPAVDQRARRFALRAIAAQPEEYAATVGHGLGLTFDWKRHPYPTPWTTGLYRFSRRPMRVPEAPVVGGGTGTSVVQAYSGTRSDTHVAEPYAGWLRGYQQQVFLRGPLLAVILAAGLTGVIRRRAPALPWATAVCLLTVPLLTTDFDYRYVLAAVPPACLSGALVVFGSPGEGALPDADDVPPRPARRGAQRARSGRTTPVSI